MNPDPQSGSYLYWARVVLAALTMLLLALNSQKTLAQSTNTPLASTAPSTQPQSQSATQQPSPAPNDDLAQMRTDLDRMESLLGNMSSEIEFLRDQNLQILLRTNAQMWTIVIRDLRRQVDREEQRSHR
jgi:hypothetical protein